MLILNENNEPVSSAALNRTTGHANCTCNICGHEWQEDLGVLYSLGDMTIECPACPVGGSDALREKEAEFERQFQEENRRDAIRKGEW